MILYVRLRDAGNSLHQAPLDIEGSEIDRSCRAMAMMGFMYS